MEKRRNCSLGAISPLFHNIFNISNFRSQITYSFVKCGCAIYCFPHFYNSDISRYGYLEVFQRVPWNSRYWESTVYGPAHETKTKIRPVWPATTQLGLYLHQIWQVLVHSSLNSIEAVEGTCDQRRLWSDCADAQADLSLRWSHKSSSRFCRALGHLVKREICSCRHY